jgi:hypothetical protein
MDDESKHDHFCFAGQPAPCKGYFLNDVLPCVCGAEGDAVEALGQVAVPAPLRGMPVPAEQAPAMPVPVEERAA